MPPAGQQPNASDNSAGILWGTAAIFAAIGGAWFIFKKQIIFYYLSLKLVEVKLLYFLNPDYYAGLEARISNAIAHPAGIDIPQLFALGNAVGDTLRYPCAIILFILAIVVYFFNTTRVFKRSYQMRDLAKLEKTNWPQISPVLDVDLAKTDIDKGRWAMAMTPMQFCKRYKLLEEVQPERRAGTSRKEWGRVSVILKSGEANKAFALQLGALWEGAEKLPLHTKALFAVFAARINADTQAAAELLVELNNTYPAPFHKESIEKLLKKHLHSKRIVEIPQSHAYVLTVMATMLACAREDGVQASADFLWLKPLDRRLWYMLNTVGRQTPFAEVAGVFAHWRAEQEAGRRLLVPVIEEATKALALALTEVVYHPDEV